MGRDELTKWDSTAGPFQDSFNTLSVLLRATGRTYGWHGEAMGLCGVGLCGVGVCGVGCEGVGVCGVGG